MLIAVLLGVTALALGLRGRQVPAARSRVRRIGSDLAAPSPARTGRESLRALRFVIAVGIAAAAMVGFRGGLGVVVGLVGAAGGVSVLGRDPPQPVASADEVALAVDLIGGCLDAGLSILDGLVAAGSAVNDPVIAAACRSTVEALRRGDHADEAWSGWLGDPVLAPIGRTAARASRTGAAFAAELRRSAGRLRMARRTAVRQKVQRVSVLVAVPLGLCFLPAFVCVAVVPTVVGLFPSLHR
jgi:hypothetical protein